MHERRAAPRTIVDPAVEAKVGGTTVRIAEISAVGARLEHDQRFTLADPELEIVIAGSSAMLPIRVVRSEIVGQSGGKLLYRTGIEFTGELLLVDKLLILIGGEPVAPERPALDIHIPQAPEPVRIPASAEPRNIDAHREPARPADFQDRAGVPDAAPSPASGSPVHNVPGEDTWTRRVNFFSSDADDDLPYARYRLDGNRWKKDYVASPDQPEDGFTLLRHDNDFAILQRTYMRADAETRKMIRNALQAKLATQVR